MKKAILIASVTVMALATFYPNPVNAGMDWQKLNIAIGVGSAFPIRSGTFTENTDGFGFYRHICGEYELSEKFSLGATYGGTDFDLDDGGEFNVQDWGGYGIIHLDLIPENNWTIWLKFGGVRNEAQTLTGNVFVPKDEVGDKGLSQQSLPTPSWEMFGGAGVEFYALGDTRLRMGVNFWDIVDNRVGSLEATVEVVFSPWLVLH